MGALTNATPAQTMSSREIAELTGKRHDNVMRTIRDLIGGQILTPQIEESNFKHAGNCYKCFFLNKRDSLVTVARLSPEFTAAVVDRWQELEAKQADPMAALTNAGTLRGLLLGFTEQVIALEHRVEELTPKAQAHDRIANCDGLFGVREAAKTLKIKQSELTTLLVNLKWAYRDRRDVLQAYADKVDQGYVTSVMSGPIVQKTGQDKVFSHFRITAKGVTRLAQILNKGVAA